MAMPARCSKASVSLSWSVGAAAALDWRQAEQNPVSEGLGGVWTSP